ncbi:MAG: hydrogenase iron-sulfur subunit [Desulfobacterales bacterium]|nr:hydrogenase iron-sulfur subunit [Desulfobacterales bacterium]
MRLVRVMCSGRIDLEFILRAFAKGQDGVFIGGCRLGECNYTTHGNFDALAVTHMGKKILEKIGLNPARLRIEFMSGADGNLLAEKTDEFTEEIKGLGSLGSSEGLNDESGRQILKVRLEAAQNMVPYLRLAERERLRVTEKTAGAYESFFTSSEFDRLFDEVFSDLWAMGQIMVLLKKSPLSTGDISALLKLSPSKVSNYMNRSSRLGWVRYDPAENRYRPAV